MNGINRLDGPLFLNMVKGGAGCLRKNRQTVNELNVFPVPDGDTGDNMFLTIREGAMEASYEPLCEMAGRVSRGMVHGARGNSGVILSQIFAGISKGLADCDEADVLCFGKAMQAAVEESYRAVEHPVEGTILTVFRDSVTFANERITDESSIDSYMRDLLEESHRALSRTPDQLPVLKEAGVVDSGGAGLIYIIEGMIRALRGEEIELGEEEEKTRKIDFSLFDENSELTWGYCTEFLLRLQNSKGGPDRFDLEEAKSFLRSIGNSIVAFRDGSIVKVHVHTLEPGSVLSHFSGYGAFLTVKIENMNLQHNETVEKEEIPTLVLETNKPYGIVCVASGKGIRDTFLSLGVDEVIEGGQTMNPSTEDFLRAFDRVPARTIFVFPNNGNIILAARQAAEIYTRSEVVVVPSRSIGAGYAALSMLDFSSGDTDGILRDLEEVMESIATGEVSRAIRNARLGGREITEGDYIGFCGDKVLSDEKDRKEALCSLAAELGIAGRDIAIVVSGADVPESEAEETAAHLQERFPKTEVIHIRGEQPVYDYLLVLE
ncbi:MAG: DAK2 domain-containing protein [Clostridia bacterium]|nr:DAK2 domain-containing protein [Clostridia bacterium]